jgi:hypothetical protein
MVLIKACGSPPLAPPPSAASGASPGVHGSASVALESSEPSVRPSPTPVASVDPSATPIPPDLVGALPVREDALPVGLEIAIAPGADGSLFVGIPSDHGAFIARLDRSGRPIHGWPIRIANATVCDRILTAGDASIRAICDTPDLPGYEGSPPDQRIHAFDRDGRALTGWPVVVRPVATARLGPGNSLLVVHDEPITDVIRPDVPSHRVSMSEVTADGTVLHGADVPLLDSCCPGWTIGPSGVAYTVSVLEGWNRVITLDRTGSTVLPTAFDGKGSRPAILPSGEVGVFVGRRAPGASQLMAIDPMSGSWRGVDVPMTTLGSDDGVDCVMWTLHPPVVSPAGVSFIWSDVDDSIAAFDLRLKALTGWPVDGITPHGANPDRNVDGLSCATPIAPVARVGDVLVLPVDGGRLTAIGRTGRVEEGWPVRLKRPGSEFWVVTADEHGTVYALAIEPESERRASGTILAIEPDSTVRYSTTIIDP